MIGLVVALLILRANTQFVFSTLNEQEITLERFDKLTEENNYNYPLSKHRMMLLIAIMVKNGLVRIGDSEVIIEDKKEQGQKIAKEFVDTIYERSVLVCC